MKKHTVAILSILMILSCLVFLTACGIISEPPHEHNFNQHNTDGKYLISAATCTSNALYYYSCTCGERGEETFVHGKPLGHTGGIATCTEQATCERCGERYGKIDRNRHRYADGACALCGEPQTSGLNYILSKDGTYYSVGRGGCSSEKVYIPAKHNGKPVTRIDDKAFYGFSSMTSVIIPSSVTSIGKSAFYDCRGLTDVAIPDSVTVIEASAFCDCWGLTNITIPSSVTTIGFGAFEYCRGLKSVEIPSSVTSIGNRAFHGCVLLESATISGAVTSIGSMMFDSCSGLTSVTIPDSVTRIESAAFMSCFKLKDLNMPRSLEKIDNYAFYDCGALTELTLPNSVTDIGDYAFYGCAGLTDVYYAGSEEQWALITVGGDNGSLIEATRHYG